MAKPSQLENFFELEISFIITLSKPYFPYPFFYVTIQLKPLSCAIHSYNFEFLDPPHFMIWFDKFVVLAIGVHNVAPAMAFMYRMGDG